MLRKSAIAAVAAPGALVLFRASAALAGSNYEAGPTVGDNGVAAGLILLVAIGVVLLLKGNAAPPPPPADDDDEDKPAG